MRGHGYKWAQGPVHGPKGLNACMNGRIDDRKGSVRASDSVQMHVGMLASTHPMPAAASPWLHALQWLRR